MTATAVAVSAARELTPAELQLAHRYLTQTRDAFTGAIKGLSAEQWTFTPAPDRWSAAEVSEHIIFVLERLLSSTREKLAEAPPPAYDRDNGAIDAAILNGFPNRINSFRAPAFFTLMNRFQTSTEALALIPELFDGIAEYLDSTPDLREHCLDAPPLAAVSQGAYSVMDGYQWIIAATAHTERHAKQIVELRACANFPAN